MIQRAFLTVGLIVLFVLFAILCVGLGIAITHWPEVVFGVFSVCFAVLAAWTMAGDILEERKR